MSVAMKDPRTFFVQGSANQYEFVLGLYDEAIKLKAQQKNKKAEEYMKLDKWYQIDLPKKIKSRGSNAHLTHEELVKCMRWKQNRGKYSPRFKDLIQMNTPRLCELETKKAFRQISKKDDLPSAIQALCNLKGVGPAMASVILTASYPEHVGFMADECLMAIPQIETIDYTTKELLNFIEHLKLAAQRLNNEAGDTNWNCHMVEKSLWAFFVIAELNKDLLRDMPDKIAAVAPAENGVGENSDSADDISNKNGAQDELSNDSTMDKTSTNGGLISPEAENSNASFLSHCEDSNQDTMDSIQDTADSMTNDTNHDTMDSNHDVIGNSNHDSSPESGKCKVELENSKEKSENSNEDKMDTADATSKDSKNLENNLGTNSTNELSRLKLDTPTDDKITLKASANENNVETTTEEKTTLKTTTEDKTKLEASSEDKLTLEASTQDKISLETPININQSENSEEKSENCTEEPLPKKLKVDG